MALPLSPPLQPQLAKSRTTLPEGEEWRYEPKYDGFRALAFVENEDVTLQSRSGRPLRRYFPELEFMPGRYVLDGEIIIGDPEGEQDFNALQQRLHPAESRVRRLAEETPARYVAFDLLASGDERGERIAALVERPVEQGLVVGGEEVEGHVARRGLLRQPPDPRLGRVQALLERVEVLHALGVADDDLPVEHVPARHELELGEVAAQRAPRARLQGDVVPVHEGERAEAVVLGLVAPPLTLRKRRARLGELGGERRSQGKRHSRRSYGLAAGLKAAFPRADGATGPVARIARSP